MHEFELAIELVVKHSMGDRDATGNGGAGLSSSSSSSASSSSSYRVKMLDIVVRAIATAVVRTRKRMVEARRSIPPTMLGEEEEEEGEDGETKLTRADTATRDARATGRGAACLHRCGAPSLTPPSCPRWPTPTSR